MKLNDFFDRLKVQMQLLPVEPHQVEQISELTQHTAEFTVTAAQHSPRDVENLLSTPNVRYWSIDVADRFGAYGISGAVCVTLADAVVHMDLLLLSCRVMGKRVEHMVLRELGQLGRAHGCTDLALRYRITSRNKAAGVFVKEVAGQYLRTEADGFSATIPLGEIERLSFQTLATAPSTTTQRSSTAAPQIVTARWRAIQPQERSRLLTEIAQLASQGEQIVAAIQQQQHRLRPKLDESFVAPRTEVEQIIADICQELLSIGQVGIHDNFFALGGHSLLATQLIARLRDRFGVEPSLRHLFDNPTVAGLAVVILQAQAEQVDNADLDRLLSELEELSEHEAHLQMTESRSEPQP